MPRRPPAVELAMEAQSRLRQLRRETAPLFSAALSTGDYALISETHALAGTLRAAGVQARRIAGLAEAISCPDGLARAGHGRAA
jgi:HPt (histidine-containing phosphotransfer) domain-containing protein